MNRSTTITAFTAAASLALTGSAAAATPAQLRANAGTLVARKCAQVAGKGCHSVQARDAGRSYYQPAAGFLPGSMRFAYRFGGWANWTNPAAGWYNCAVYVKNTVSASGMVQC